jgi:hypothetical protein
LACGSYQDPESLYLISEPFFLKKSLNQHSIFVFIGDSMPDGTGSGTYPQY